jgi:hypothetical protein
MVRAVRSSSVVAARNVAQAGQVRLVVSINPRIATALSGYGFKQEDMAEGWALVNGLGKGKLAVLPTEPRDMETLLKLDAWENQWFPIAAAALQRRFPAAAAKFFLNLQQTEGPEVAISVRTFTDRYEELAAGSEKYGAEAKKALTMSRTCSSVRERWTKSTLAPARRRCKTMPS